MTWREKIMVSEIPFLPLPFHPHCHLLVSKPSPPKFASCWAQINSLLTLAVFLHAVTHFWVPLGFPRGASGKEPACQCGGCKRCSFDPWVRNIPWRRKWQSTPVFLPGEFHGQRSLASYSPWARKESDMNEHLSSSCKTDMLIVRK